MTSPWDGRATKLLLMASVCSMIAFWTASATADEVEDTPEQPQSVADPSQVIKVDIGEDIVEIPFAITAEGYAVLEGDMILGSAAEVAALVGGDAILQGVGDYELFGLFSITRNVWPLGVVKYRISRRLPKRERVEGAIRMWANATNIMFEEAERDERNFLEFVRADDRSNCSSDVGFQGGRQYIFVGDACGKGHVAHEIGHALGATHEQMRADQSEFIAINFNNIKDGFAADFTPKPWAYVEVGQYCYGSIMHYGEKAFTRNGRPTIVPKQSGASIGQRLRIAGCDRDMIQSAYEKEFAKR